MKTSKYLLNCSIGIVIALFACFLIVGMASNSGTQLLAECELPKDGGVLRLSTTHGSSVTTSDSWTVSYQTSKRKKYTIFSSYSSPGIKNIECGQDQVVFIFYPNEPIIIPLSWIKEELIFRPVTFYKSELRSPEYREEVSTWKGVYP